MLLANTVSPSDQSYSRNDPTATAAFWAAAGGGCTRGANGQERAIRAGNQTVSELIFWLDEILGGRAGGRAGQTRRSADSGGARQRR